MNAYDTMNQDDANELAGEGWLQENERLKAEWEKRQGNGAGEADTRSPDNGSQDADQVVTDAPAPAPSGDWDFRAGNITSADAP